MAKYDKIAKECDTMRPEKISSERIFSGKIMNVEKDMVCLENGMEVEREVVRHRPAVCVFAYDKDGYGYLVKQYRYPFDEYTTEVVAGLCGKGESAEESAKRELNEEIDALCDNLVFLGEFYPTPGYCDEKISMFAAKITGFRKGTPDPDEFIEKIRLPLPRLYEMAENGEIKDGKTVALILKAKNLFEKGILC